MAGGCRHIPCSVKEQLVVMSSYMPVVRKHIPLYTCHENMLKAIQQSECLTDGTRRHQVNWMERHWSFSHAMGGANIKYSVLLGMKEY